MNYNPNIGMPNPQGPRKIKRVSDVNAMGPSIAAPMPNAPPYMQPQAAVAMNVGGFNPAPQMATAVDGFNSASVPMQSQNYGYVSQPTSQPQAYSGVYAAPSAAQMQFGGIANSAAPTQVPQFGGSVQNPPMAAAPIGGQFLNAQPQFAMFQQPIVQDMAMQYGQHLADQGKQLMENQFEKYIPVAKLKYYFAVDNNYVIKKLRLLLFPFAHKDWSLKYDQENPVQPRYDINAPDLYIPTMAYITYVVVAGLMLGLKNQFTPEQLGIQASSALAYSLFELVVYSITLYVVNIKTNLKTLDLLAFSGYKFVIIVVSLLASTLFYGMGYYVTLIYTSLALGFFLLRTLKTKVLHETTSATASGPINYDPYGNPQQLDYTGGRKRKLYFLFLIVGGQALLSFLLSKHLYFTDLKLLTSQNLRA